MRASRGWLVVAALLVLAGWWLRWRHLGTPSLWWDELVQIRMADLPSLTAVLTSVRLGVPAGSGNAGAVPLDYALLWAWLRAVPMPAPEALETYFRTPSFIWSCALVPLIGWWTWRCFGVASGLATTTLAAGSIPLVLYAAEARFYSLFCLLTVANLATFAALLRAPERLGAWARYGIVAMLLFLAGLFGLLLLAWQLLALAVVVAQGRRRHPSPRATLAALGGVTLVLAAVVLWYFADTNLAARSVRGPTRLPLWPNLTTTLGFFGMNAPALPWLLALGPFAALAIVWRRHRALLPAIACTVVALAVGLPVILTIAESKQHFFHPRHALFMLPLLLLLLGVAIGGIADAALPRRLAPAAALAVALALVAPTAARYVGGPWWFFDQTKALHDFRGVARVLRDRTRDYGPDDRYLLVATRGRGGHLGNPVLAWYLTWYGIADRVILRASTRPAETIAFVRERCWTSCHHLSALLERALALVSAHQLTGAKIRLLDRSVMRTARAGTPRHIGFAVYPPLERWQLGSLEGYRAWRRRGLHLYELDRPPFP